MFNDEDWDDDIFSNINSFGQDDENCSCDNNCSKKKECCQKKKTDPDICQKCGGNGKVDRCACICTKCGHVIWGC